MVTFQPMRFNSFEIVREDSDTLLHFKFLHLSVRSISLSEYGVMFTCLPTVSSSCPPLSYTSLLLPDQRGLL